MAKKKNKYRIRKYWSIKNKAWYYAPDIQKSFLLIKYWSCINNTGYLDYEDAMAVINYEMNELKQDYSKEIIVFETEG